MKKCSRCSNEIIAKYTHNGSYCRQCRTNYQKEYAKKTNYKQAKKRKDAIRELIIKAKDKICADCKISYPFYKMDFDHVRGEKKFDLSIASRKGYSLASVLEETKKCDVVCANCHRQRTFIRSGLA